MITSIERIGTQEDHDGWFLVNKHLQVRFNESNDGLTMDINFDDDILTDQEANELANELLQESINTAKKIHNEL